MEQVAHSRRPDASGPGTETARGENDPPRGGQVRPEPGRAEKGLRRTVDPWTPGNWVVNALREEDSLRSHSRCLYAGARIDPRALI